MNADGPAPQWRVLGLHIVLTLAIIVAICAQATWRLGLWPFDPRYSALVAGVGLLIVIKDWAVAWLIMVGLACLLSRARWRLALWPIGICAMMALHAAFGPSLGFRAMPPVAVLGLYALPVALMLILGGAIRAALSLIFPKFRR